MKGGNKMRFEIYDSYKEYSFGYPCSVRTDDENEAFGYKNKYPKCVVFDTISKTFLE